MFAAMLRVEHFQRENLNEEVQYGSDGVGYGGPINAAMVESPPVHMRNGIRSLGNLGLKRNLESLNGENIGTMYQPASYRLSTHTRSYSVDYLPRAENLVFLFNTTVERVELNSRNTKVTGVVLTSGRTIEAKKEVILSAGSLLSPKILELSGIGQKGILAAAGIKQKVDLPGVGENLQDHLRIQNTYELKPEIPAFDVLKYNSTRAALELDLYRRGETSLYQYAGSAYGFARWDSLLTPSSTRNLLRLAHQSVDVRNPVDRKKLQLMLDSKGVPNIQFVISDGYTGPKGYPRPGMLGHGKNYATIFAGLTHPFARGSVHINTSSPLSSPLIDPKFLSTPYDIAALISGIKFVRKIASTPPYTDVYTKEFDPGSAVETDAGWEKYVRDNIWTFFHPLGTCAMLPKEDRGVVDAKLRVYGVKNLRVVDASVFPIVISGNIQTAVYGIAERAADIVTKEYGK